MKINRITQNKKRKIPRSDNFFLNIYYFFYFYGYISLTIIGVAFSAFIILLILDLLAPKTLKSLDEKATLELFNQLQEANRHNEAIILMEYKGDVMNNTPLELEYKSKLSDSYIHVGDYSKAEKMLLDAWNRADIYLSDLPKQGLMSNTQVYNFLKFGLARTIYQFYEKIGDKKNQIKFFHIYKHWYDKCGGKVDSLSIDIYNSRTWFQKKNILNSKELIEYDSIVVAYEYNKHTAITAMNDFVDKIINRHEYSPAYKVKCLNKLIGWYLTENKAVLAYPKIT